MSVNKVILVGNVGVDPEVKYLDGGTAVCNFRLATSETYKSKNGERVTQTEWHNVVLWRGLAEIAEKYVKKGMQLYIEGRIRTRAWDDKDGNKRYTTEIIGDVMQMLGRKGDNESSDERSNQGAQASSNTSQKAPEQGFNPNDSGDEVDDLPF